MPFARISDLVHSLRFRLTLWVTLMVFLIVAVTMIIVSTVVRGALLNEFHKNQREDFGEVEEDIALVNRVMVLAGVSILVLAPIGGYLLYRRAMRPLSWIIETTGRLQPKNLKERLPMRGTGDELDQLSKTINGMLDRIAAYIESNRDFIANAAHELRSPLAAIRSSVDVALDRLRTPDEYSALLTDVAEECNRLTNLLNQLMLLAEGDAGRLALLNQTARLDKIVLEAVDMFEPVAEALSVNLKLVAAPPVSVRGEEYHLRQVVRNLIDNATKFTPPGGRIEVELISQREAKQSLLRVADTGIGIPEEEVPRVFERFYRVDKSRTREWSAGGNGLGLAICQAVVAALEGRIDVVSQLGVGTTFTVVLPLAAASPEDVKVATEELKVS
ncbi:MAG: HAMP domain-containing histidine kinase [Gemmataceae bacterium]|nr:HAMP domain-containing histidine kinase [Gemmataceae bacterium]